MLQTSDRLDGVTPGTARSHKHASHAILESHLVPIAGLYGHK